MQKSGELLTQIAERERVRMLERKREREKERERERAVAALCSLVKALKRVRFIPGSFYYRLFLLLHMKKKTPAKITPIACPIVQHYT